MVLLNKCGLIRLNNLDYKALFHIAMLLISSPAKAWEEIRLEEDRRKVFTAFVYPMIGYADCPSSSALCWRRGGAVPRVFNMP